MKKSLIFCAILSCAILCGAEKIYFSGIREKVAKTSRFSPEDFELGAKLLIQIRELAATRTPALPQPLFHAETLSSAGRMWFTNHNYTDRQLFCARDVWESGSSQHKTASHKKTFELLTLSGFDAHSSFLYGADMPISYLKNHALLKPALKFIPTLTPAGHNGKLEPALLKRAAQSPHTLKIDGKLLISCWTGLDIKKNADFIRQVESYAGMPVAFIYSCGTITNYADPFNFYHRDKRVPASVLLYWFDYLSKLLESSAGIEYSNYLTRADGTFFAEYYDEVILPLFAAILAQDKYNGKKYFGLQIMTGYNNYRGKQRLSTDGTKTLRAYMHLVKKYRVDIIKAFEWDEYNEDSHFQPTVNKPMAFTRITNYCFGQLKGKTPAPFPGDDLTLPNLILSQRKQVVSGMDFQLEVLHVPDSKNATPYSVKVEILDTKGTIISERNMKFNRSELQAHTILIPTGDYISSDALVTRLTIDYLGEKRVISEGLPFTVIRPTTVCDTTWYSTPLRNVLFPVKADIAFGKVSNPAAALPERIELPVKADLQFSDTLNSVEVVQNGRDNRFSYDSRNEYLQNDPDRLNLILTFYNLEVSMKISRRCDFTADISIANAPGAMRFVHAKDKRNIYLTDVSQKAAIVPFTAPYTIKARPSSWRNAHIFSIRKSEAAQAVLNVNGTITAGTLKGQKFSCALPVAKLQKAGVYNIILDNGIQIALEIPQRMDIMPLPLNTAAAKFETTLHTGYPYGVFAVRAVSRNGKVYWSKPMVIARQNSGKNVEISTFNDRKGTAGFKIDASKVPHIKYRFTPEPAGNIITTCAGREFYANAGGYDMVPTGYEGYHCSVYSIPYSFRKYRTPESKYVPKYEKLPDGTYCLDFSGKGEFIGFPPSLFPQRSGCTVKFEFMPRDVESDQVYFVHAEHTLSGFRLRTEDGRLVADFHRRQNTANARENTVVFKTNLDPVEIIWNSVVFKYDLETLSITLNGKTESFPCKGISCWLAVGGFGGDGTTSTNSNQHYFNGKLKSFEVIHSAK